MRDDLLHAQASVNWAVSEIPRFREAFNDWQRAYPYEVVRESDPDSETHDLIVAIERTPLPLAVNVQAGMMINALRSALDQVAASLARRNGIIPNRDTHFPIFQTAAGAADLKRGLDSKKCKHWLSDRERAIIKSLAPYEGGDEVLWPLNELDVLRKHERLVSAGPNLHGITMMGSAQIRVGGQRILRRLNEKTVLYRLARDDFFSASPGNTLLACEVVFNEPRIGLKDEEAVALIRKFVSRVSEIIAMFDT